VRLEPLDGLDEKLAHGRGHGDRPGQRGRRPRPPIHSGRCASWLDLPTGLRAGPPVDTESVERLLAGLVVWCGAGILRYADAVRHFPECWLWHPDVLEGTDLATSRVAVAPTRTRTPGRRAWDWHDRYRPGVVRRIRDMAGRCSPQRPHSPRRPARPPTATGVREMGALADWWAGSRQAAPTRPQRVGPWPRPARTSPGGYVSRAGGWTTTTARPPVPPRRVLVHGEGTFTSPWAMRAALAQAWGDGRGVLVTGSRSSGAERMAERVWRAWGGRVEATPRGWGLHRHRPTIPPGPPPARPLAPTSTSRSARHAPSRRNTKRPGPQSNEPAVPTAQLSRPTHRTDEHHEHAHRADEMDDDQDEDGL